MSKGYSLVELLVVIAIVLILIALVMPVYTFVVEHAKQVICQNNMKNIHSGFMSYSNDQRGNLPYYENFGVDYDDGTLTTVAMWWGFPVITYLIPDLPPVNPSSGNPWRNPGDKGSFPKFLNQHYPSEQTILYCPAGDNGYFNRAYEGQRKYMSNYRGYLGPGTHFHAVARNRDYQSKDVVNDISRPINTGIEPGSTWLIADYHWSNKEYERGVNTGHHNYNKNILHLDGSAVVHAFEFWRDTYEWLDKFPEH